MSRQIMNWNHDWKFRLVQKADDLSMQWTADERKFLGEPPETKDADGLVWTKAGKCFGPAKPDYDDAAWDTLNLPHDWSVTYSPRPEDPQRNGFLRLGIGWYRKTLRLVQSDRGKAILLQFDGVYRNARVFVNGNFAAHNESGYLGFTVDISELVEFGRDNLVSVFVDARKKEGWFYEGAGIYRHVWLIKTSPIRIAPHGLFVHAQIRNVLRNAKATLTVQTELENETDDTARVTVDHVIENPQGKRVKKVTATGEAASASTTRLDATCELEDVTLWSDQMTALYRVLTTVRRGNKVVDRTEQTFGLRTIKFDPKRGFLLNGKSVKLKGVCMHQDHAGVGSAIPDRLQAWRLEQLQKIGVNAYRCSHNPPSPVVLDACDRMGILVMDETRPFGVSREHLDQLRCMVKRDRNHPCVVIWSLGNEEMAVQHTEIGQRMGRRMHRVVRSLDDTRPTTIAVNYGWEDAHYVAESVDVHGLNYLSLGDVDKLHRRKPKLPLVVSEACSTVTTRGVYHTDAGRGVLDAYGTQETPDGMEDLWWPFWGRSAEAMWNVVGTRDFLAGTFVWTGMDYRGEQTPFNRWPAVGSHFGMMDLCGYPKDVAWYYRAWWRDEPVLHLFPHWNWGGREGQPIDVWAHTNCEQVELFLNGESLGTRKVEPLGHVAWQVAWQPGELRAVGHHAKAGEITTQVATTGPAAVIYLFPDRDQLIADGNDLAVVTVQICDDNERPCPTADHAIAFEVEGPARIIGLGNGDPNSHEPDQPQNGVATRRLFNGLAQCILQTTQRAGRIRLRAATAGCESATVTLHTRRP